MKNTVRERLTEYLKVKKISKSAFGRAIDASSAFVTSIRKTIGAEKIQAIALNFPDLNIEWLLTGEGEMLKTQSVNSVVTGDVSGNGNQIVAGNNNHIGTTHPRPEDIEVIEPEEIELKTTPILTPDIVNKPGLDIMAGMEAGTLQVETKLTQDIVPDGVVKVYLENDEMAPDIEANDPVLIRRMDDKQAIIHGRMYFVDLYRGAVVRWVFPQNDGTLLLKSKNAPDMIVQPESVQSISEVVTIWKRPKCLPNDHVSMFEELRRRDDQMDELLAQQGRLLAQQGQLIGIIEEQISK